MRGQMQAGIRPGHEVTLAGLASRYERAGDLPVSRLNPGTEHPGCAFQVRTWRDIAGEQIAKALMP